MLDAVIELFSEGMLLPAAIDVAERSGVSQRSVFRYFEDTEGLARAAIRRHIEVVGPLFELPDAAVGRLEDRIERLVSARLRLWEAVAPVARAALVRAPAAPLIAAQLDTTRRRLRAQVDEVFADEAAACEPGEARALLTAAELLCSYDSIEHLRGHHGLSVAQTRDVLVRALTRLLR